MHSFTPKDNSILDSSLYALATQDAARFLGISASIVAKMRGRECGLHYFKIGRRVSYSLPDLMAFRESKRVRSTWEYAL